MVGLFVFVDAHLHDFAGDWIVTVTVSRLYTSLSVPHGVCRTWASWFTGWDILCAHLTCHTTTRVTPSLTTCENLRGNARWKKKRYSLVSLWFTPWGLNLSLASSFTTSRELLSQFSPSGGWKWLEVGYKWENKYRYY